MKPWLYYLLFFILILLVLFLAVFISLPDKKLHVVFCDVGQGDAIYIQTPSGSDILIDGGPSDKIISCLSSHMPFYDRKIELVILTHPQSDHYTGLISVLERYAIDEFKQVEPVIENKTAKYEKLKDLLKKGNIKENYLFSGGKVVADGLNILTLWPISDSPKYTKNTDKTLNANSLVLRLSYGGFDMLLPGDADEEVQQKLEAVADVEVLKVPHHGSKQALSLPFLDMIRPQLAVISVGKNSYGHPSKETINKLTGRKIEVLRTDEKGDIELISDSHSWWVKE
jgi:competence protein ComEC